MATAVQIPTQRNPILQFQSLPNPAVNVTKYIFEKLDI